MTVGLKIMPSYNTENNMIFMERVNDVSIVTNPSVQALENRRSLQSDASL
jgi:hypothetical protein